MTTNHYEIKKHVFHFALPPIKGKFHYFLFETFLNPIPLEIIRFRLKTIPQIKIKQQGLRNKHKLEAIWVKLIY